MIINELLPQRKIEVRYNYSDSVLSFLILAASIAYRPMILGNYYTIIGIILFTIVIVLSVWRNHGKIILSSKKHLRTYVSSIVLFIYCLLQGLVLSDRKQDGMQTVVILLVAVTAYYIAFSNDAVLVLFIRKIYILLSFFSCSYIFSLIIMLFKGWNSIHIASIDYGYFTGANIYLPFTITYGEMPFSGLLLKRLLGFARESGIMQIFYVWGFFSVKKYFQKTRIIQLLMVTGILACLSTAGFIVFGISLLLYYDVGQLLKRGGFRRTIVILGLICAVIYVLFYARGTRITDRSIATITDRTSGIEYGLNVFYSRPLFGGGFYSTLGSTGLQVGVCALASIGQIGLIGIVLWLCIYFFTFLDSKNKRRFVYTNAAHFITAVFSQPIMFAPVMYWFMFCDYSDDIYMLVKRGGISRNYE